MLVLWSTLSTLLVAVLFRTSPLTRRINLYGFGLLTTKQAHFASPQSSVLSAVVCASQDTLCLRTSLEVLEMPSHFLWTMLFGNLKQFLKFADFGSFLVFYDTTDLTQ